MQHYYLIEREQVLAPYRHTVSIQTVSACNNMSGAERLNGWCGTTNDIAVHAHGEYNTIDGARAAMYERFGSMHLINDDCSDPDVVEEYGIGKYPVMDEDATEDFCYDGMRDDIHGNTTDAEIADLVETYREAARQEVGCELSPLIEAILTAYRDGSRSGWFRRFR
jgi:hypothetical protein